MMHPAGVSLASGGNTAVHPWFTELSAKDLLTCIPRESGPKAPVTESSMWGMTPMDQLGCRIQLKEMRYEGQYTPPSTKGSLAFPGSFGVFEWGSVSIDPRNHLLIANTSWMPLHTQLVPRDKNADLTALSPAQYRERFGFGGAAIGTRMKSLYGHSLGPQWFLAKRPRTATSRPWI
jgi:hypothetical protein